MRAKVIDSPADLITLGFSTVTFIGTLIKKLYDPLDSAVREANGGGAPLAALSLSPVRCESDTQQVVGGRRTDGALAVSPEEPSTPHSLLDYLSFEGQVFEIIKRKFYSG